MCAKSPAPRHAFEPRLDQRIDRPRPVCQRPDIDRFRPKHAKHVEQEPLAAAGPEEPVVNDRDFDEPLSCDDLSLVLDFLPTDFAEQPTKQFLTASRATRTRRLIKRLATSATESNWTANSHKRRQRMFEPTAWLHRRLPFSFCRFVASRCPRRSSSHRGKIQRRHRLHRTWRSPRASRLSASLCQPT